MQILGIWLKKTLQQPFLPLSLILLEEAIPLDPLHRHPFPIPSPSHLHGLKWT
jgi:hypothetical protein